MQPSPRSSHSAQSGLPSSGSDDEGPPLPLVAPASWTLGVEDGQGGERTHRLPRAPVASVGCRGAPRDSRPRDRDGEGQIGCRRPQVLGGRPPASRRLACPSRFAYSAPPQQITAGQTRLEGVLGPPLGGREEQCVG
ncbi:hypothetical protein D1007_31648 [Hordeum vulgare]|nr:hypothetical protein D1007_31648 [Hordeum vulgare]